MSIIEKAVGKLEKRVKTDKTGDPGRASVFAPDAIQKAASGHVANGQAKKQNSADITAEGTSTGAGLSGSKIVVKIPFDELHARGMLTPGVPRSAVAEEFRTIKRPLLKNIDGDSAVPVDNANLVMVASALQNEGKTYTSVNLAMSIAMELDKTVLYVDADTSKASAGILLGVPHSSPGLIDVLENKGVTLGDVILRTNMEKLSIVPAGNVHSHSNELLASDGMRKLMQELSHRYADRVIVFDSPPLLMTNEAGVLASFMGQIVFVASANITPHHAITKALEHIGADKMVGMVLNRARTYQNNMFGYGYGYGYGYGRSVRDQELEPEAARNS